MRPDHVGDVLLSSPAVALLRASLPHARITYLVGPWSAEAARAGPAVDEVRTLRFPGFTRERNRNLVQPYLLLAQQAFKLRQENFDLAVILRADHWWGALLALSASIPLRVGGRTPETQPLLSHEYAPRPGEHWAQQALEIARLALAAGQVNAAEAQPTTVFEVSEQARAEADAWLQQHGLFDQQLVAIHPGAGAVLKSWPAERWAEVAAAVPAGVVLSGAPGDEALLHSIQQHMRKPAAVACGQSLEVSAALFGRCAVVIAPDSGAAHLAAAVGTPTVRLYGPASASVFGPWPGHPRQRVLVTSDLACLPCDRMVDPPCGARAQPACMLALGSEDVLAAVSHLLAETEN